MILRLTIPSLFVVLGASLLACGGTTAGTGDGAGGSLSGTVAGTTFPVASVVGVIEPASSNETCSGGPGGGQTCTTTSSGQVVAVILTNRADATCSFLQSESGSNIELANMEGLLLGVASENGTVVPGTYPVVSSSNGAFPSTGALAMLESTTATCASGAQRSATSGTITLTAAGPGEIAGSYSVTFGTDGSFTGSFDVSTCTIPDAGTSSSSTGTGVTTTPTCRP